MFLRNWEPLGIASTETKGVILTRSRARTGLPGHLRAIKAERTVKYDKCVHYC